mmetsp:Transcript_24790/g.55124  ORF Transcript_24790/g.55124 Transcript_24790/m.55124 type:complete len:103 (+) Transcript_24790:2-310(+)
MHECPRSGAMEEVWTFEGDTYTEGMLAAVQHGAWASLPQLAVAFLTPALQLIVFFSLLGELESKTTIFFQGHEATVFLCFFMMLLPLSGEALEANSKLIFAF